MKGVMFHSARAETEPHGPVLPGRVDDEIHDRLDQRNHRWQVQLREVKNHKVIHAGPWRPPHPLDTAERFALNILETPVGTTFQVCGRHRVLFRAWVVEVPLGELVIDAARTEIGTHYVFGVENGPEDPGTDAFDCSGLTLWAWGTVGVILEHNAEAQRQQMIARHSYFTSVNDADPGVLVFMWFPNSRGIPKGHASHVGLFYAHSHFVHGVGTIPNRVLDTRSPDGEPVAIRDLDLGSVVGYGRPS